ncbi:MAG TPA: glycosyltransferase family 2 protein [Acidimicrobiales bacterium]|nr:glycosyltransferase family 2 protein [Acidimicrobiales bacterium]
MTGGVVALVVDLVVLLAWIVFPFFRRGDEDKGDGFASVKITMPHKTSPWRMAIFYTISIGVTVLCVVERKPVGNWFASAVANLVNAVTARPDLTNSWDHSVVASIPVIVAANISLFGLMLKAPLLRRLMTALNGVASLLITITADAFLLVIWRDYGAQGAQVGPREFLGVILLNVGVGTLVMVRVITSSFEFPRPTAVPLKRHRWTADGAIAFMIVVGSVAVVVVAETLIHIYGTPGWIAAGSHLAYPLLWMSIFVGLLLISRRGGMPPATPERPPIDVIIPAYNETAGIHLTLRSIDRAAVRYGGPVRVILADDGSTDGTGDLARSEMAAFKAATGIVVPGNHLGKAAALNTALSYTEAEIIVRIDADIIIDEAAFVTLPAWFADPEIGTVGSMTYPRPDMPSWFNRMRLFECLVSFGFTRQAQLRVDAIACIPGTYTAFRRDPVVSIGGFVVGMNGEDTDLTMQIGRLGYKVIIDPRIVVYEDVPQTLADFREQRIRWNRAGTQVFARHSPWTSGFAGPRVWLTYFRITSMRFTSIARPIVLAFLITSSIVDPKSRALWLVILASIAVAGLPTYIAIALIAARHNLASRLRWLPFWYVFTMIRRLFIVESLFTLPTRPLRSPLALLTGGRAEDQRSDSPALAPSTLPTRPST